MLAALSASSLFNEDGFWGKALAFGVAALAQLGYTAARGYVKVNASRDKTAEKLAKSIGPANPT